MPIPIHEHMETRKTEDGAGRKKAERPGAVQSVQSDARAELVTHTDTLSLCVLLAYSKHWKKWMVHYKLAVWGK